METLLAFAPFILFVIVERLASPTAGLTAGALVSVVLLLRDWLGRSRTIKVLDIGTTVLFGGLALYSLASSTRWSIVGVRLCVDAGLMLIVLISIAVRRPFTLQYAREQVPESLWHKPSFVRTNYVITAVWAVAFAVMVAADLLMLYVPSLPTKVGVVATILAIVGAFKFTSWYPNTVRTEALPR